MFKPILTPRDIADRYHPFLPDAGPSYLKGRGGVFFAAVTGARGAVVFVEGWVPFFAVFGHVCFGFTGGGARDGAEKKVEEALPGAGTENPPADVSEGGTVTDFFVGLERT